MGVHRKTGTAPDVDVNPGDEAEGLGHVHPRLTRSTVGLSAATYAVAETAGELPITFIRVGDPFGPVTLEWETSAGTATPGTHYVETSGEIVWYDDDSDDKTATITILGGVVTNRTFNITIPALEGAEDGTMAAVATIQNV